MLDASSDVVVACPLTRLHYEDATTDEPGGMELLQDSACMRFKTFLKQIRLNNVFNGLIRAEVLRRAMPQKPYFGSDVVVMAELTLYGKFAVVPEPLFNRRMDSRTASIFLTPAQRKQMAYPRRKNAPLFTIWREKMDYFAAVWRAPLAWRERICLYRFLLGHMIRDRVDLLGDIREAGQRILGMRTE